jgi:hypothetical protein
MRAATPIVLLLAAAWPSDTAVAARAAAPAAAVSAPAPAAQHTDLARRYAYTEELRNADLLAFVRKHLAEARAGDGEAQYAIAKVLAGCATLEKRTTADGRLVRDVLDDVTATERDRRQAQIIASHCDPLDDARAEIGTAADWYQQADRNGVGAAMLEEAQSGAGFGSADARLDKLRQALASGDPEVIAALVAASDQQVHDSVLREPIDAAAVLALTQCALGYDCSGAGPIYQHACSGGCEHADSMQGYYELNMNPQEFAAVQGYAASLAANIRGGGDSFAEAQALEQSIAGPPAADSSQAR